MTTHSESDGTISDVCVLLVAGEPTQVAISVLLVVVDSFKSGNLSVPHSLLTKYTHCNRKPHKSVACVVINDLLDCACVLGPQKTDWPSPLIYCSPEVGKLLAIL